MIELSKIAFQTKHQLKTDLFSEICHAQLLVSHYVHLTVTEFTQWS